MVIFILLNAFTFLFALKHSTLILMNKQYCHFKTKNKTYSYLLTENQLYSFTELGNKS